MLGENQVWADGIYQELLLVMNMASKFGIKINENRIRKKKESENQDFEVGDNV